MSIDKKLKITEIQRFCMHDGPGIKTTFFLKGCPLRCEWCHNPETQRVCDELLFYPKKCIGCLACMTIKECQSLIDMTKRGGPRFKEKECAESKCTKCVDICQLQALTKR